MLLNSKPMNILLLGRLVSSWEPVADGKYVHNSIAVNLKDKTYYFQLLSFPTVARYNKGDKISLSGCVTKIESYNNKPRISVFVEVIERG